MVAEGSVVGQVSVRGEIDVGGLAVAALAVVVVARLRVKRRIEKRRTALFGPGVARNRKRQSRQNRPVGLHERIAGHVVRLLLDLVVYHHGIAVILGLALEIGAVAVIDRPEGIAAVARPVVVGPESPHESRLGLQLDIAGHLVVVRHIDRVLLVVVVVLHALAVVIPQAHIVAVLRVAAFDSHVVILRNGGPEHIVGPPGAIGPFAAFDLGNGGVIGPVGPYLARVGSFGAAVLVRLVLQTGHRHRIAPVVEPVAENAHADLAREPDVLMLLPAAFGRDHDDAVGAARTVNRRGRSVFQHFDRLDDARIDALEVSGVAHRNSVHDHQRGVGPVDGTDAAHPDRHAALGTVVRIVDHRQTGDAPLEQLVDRPRRNLRHVGGPHRGHASRQVALLHRTVTDHDHLVYQFGLLLKPHVHGGPAGHVHFLRLVTEERYHEHIVRGDVQGVCARRIGRRAPDGTLDHHRRARDRLSVGTARHHSPYGHLLGGEAGAVQQQGSQQHE